MKFSLVIFSPLGGMTFFLLRKGAPTLFALMKDALVALLPHMQGASMLFLLHQGALTLFPFMLSASVVFREKKLRSFEALLEGG